jgi:hypothetical protein
VSDKNQGEHSNATQSNTKQLSLLHYFGNTYTLVCGVPVAYASDTKVNTLMQHKSHCISCHDNLVCGVSVAHASDTESGFIYGKIDEQT